MDTLDNSELCNRTLIWQHWTVTHNISYSSRAVMITSMMSDNTMNDVFVVQMMHSIFEYLSVEDQFKYLLEASFFKCRIGQFQIVSEKTHFQNIAARRPLHIAYISDQRMNNHRFDTNHKDPDKPVPIHAGTHNQDFQTCYTTKILRAFPKQCNSSQLKTAGTGPPMDYQIKITTRPQQKKVKSDDKNTDKSLYKPGSGCSCYLYNSSLYVMDPK
uniref:Uncharacterized protein n=1 Tax=Timema genevievae TaxID=629358 RepID=A0A7R9K0Y5_TIMGE|nr:unnamed protein product [Timema genevievae]